MFEFGCKVMLLFNKKLQIWVAKMMGKFNVVMYCKTIY